MQTNSPNQPAFQPNPAKKLRPLLFCAAFTITSLILFLGHTPTTQAQEPPAPSSLLEITTDYTGEIKMALLENFQQCSGWVWFNSPKNGPLLGFNYKPDELPQREVSLGLYPLGTGVDFGIFVDSPCAPAGYNLADTAHVFVTRANTTWYILVYFNGVNFFAPPDLGFAVQVVPRFHPVIFIHGLGGKPSEWNNPPRDIYIKLLKQAGYDKAIIAVYKYADADNNPDTYDYQGDITKIAADLPALVNELSDLHRSRGGDGQVDIVGYSLGGLIARYYANTHKPHHNLRQIITIGTPHLGTFWAAPEKRLHLEAPASINSAFQDYMRGRYQFFLDIFVNQHNDQPVKINSDAIQQVSSDSLFLQQLNTSENIARLLSYKALYGEIDVAIRLKLFDRQIISKGFNFGDGIVSKDSATGIPVENLKTFGVSDQGVFIMKLAKNESEGYKYSIEIDQPTFEDLLSRHSNLIIHPMIWTKVLEYLILTDL